MAKAQGKGFGIIALCLLYPILCAVFEGRGGGGDVSHLPAKKGGGEQTWDREREEEGGGCEKGREEERAGEGEGGKDQKRGRREGVEKQKGGGGGGGRCT